MQNTNLNFDISPDVQSLGITGAYFVISNLNNNQSSAKFEQEKTKRIDSVIADLSAELIQSDPILNGFRLLHEKVGKTGKKYIASPENLLNMLLETKKLPSINLIVDAYNLISAETRLAIGAHDISNINGNVHLKLTTGDEKFWPLGYSKPQSVGAGEYAYIDDANDIICRMEVRQVEKTKVTADTKECFFIVQGNSATDDEYIYQTANQLIELIKIFCGGTERFLTDRIGITV